MAKLTRELEREVFEKSAKGLSSEQIADWLKKERGVEITGRSLRERLSTHRDERREVAQAVMQADLSRHVTSDLEVLETERGRAQKLATRFYDLAMQPEPPYVNADAGELYLKALDRVERITVTRLRFAGIGDEGAAKREEAGVTLPDDPEERAKVYEALAERARRASR